eukprot:scaffold99527_cov27-Tisochrysis_lutea.AAC.2
MPPNRGYMGYLQVGTEASQTALSPIHHGEECTNGSRARTSIFTHDSLPWTSTAPPTIYRRIIMKPLRQEGKMLQLVMRVLLHKLHLTYLYGRSSSPVIHYGGHKNPKIRG